MGMEAIYPITALVKTPNVVKAAARNGVVRITEHGVGAYVLCSEEVFEGRMEQAARDALYEAELEKRIARGIDDYEARRVYCGTAKAKEELNRRIGEKAHE